MSQQSELIRLVLALGARTVAGWTAAEQRLAAAATREGGRPGRGQIDRVRREIAGGSDPLGEAFCQLRPPEARRPMGATYTPDVLVQAMLAWVAAMRPAPARVVDPGVGSGRFLAAAGRRFARARLV